MLKQSPFVLALFLGASKAIQQQSADNFDTDVKHRGWANIHDPDTVGMYDDKTIYTDKAGSLKWKYPQPEDEKKKGDKKDAALIGLNDDIYPSVRSSNPEGFSDPAPIVVGNDGTVGVDPYAQVNKEKPIPTYAIPSPPPAAVATLAQIQDSYLTNTTATNPTGFSDPAPIVIKPSGVSPYERAGLNKNKPVHGPLPHYDVPPLLREVVGGTYAPASLVQKQKKQHHHRHHNQNKSDISEKQIDEEVHGFANPNTETLNWARSQDPFIMNGSKNPESGYGYVPPAELYQQRHHRYNPNSNSRRDISEKQIDEDVHDFANPNTEALNWPRTPDSFIPNGSKNPESGYGYVPPALHQHHNRYTHPMRDISERMIDEEVHGFANPNTETLNWARSQDPFIMNGSKNPESGYGYVPPAELNQY